jgi:hypothetical protein
MQYECQPSLSVVYCSILRYITATSRQYGYQPGLTGLSVVYYSILQYIAGTSRQYGYQPGVSVVYYSILPTGIVVYYSILPTGSADSSIHSSLVAASNHCA